MSKRVLLDMDGVVADFVGGVCKFFGRENPYTTLAEDSRGPCSWGIEKLLGIEPEDFWRPLGYEFWRGLPLTHDARHIFCTALWKFGESSICFCTSPCSTPGCFEGKIDWAKEHFPRIPIIFTKSTVEKEHPPKHFLAGKNSVLIDDNTYNVKNFQDAGGYGILIPRYWNSYHKNYDPSSTYVLGLEGELQYFANIRE